MQRRPLPQTSLALSALGLGCWAMGGQHWGEDVREEECAEALAWALDQGVNWVDTAPIYGGGEADRRLARALKGRRQSVLIASKVGVRVSADRMRSELTPQHLREDLEGSLRRLGVETVDLLQVHWPCEVGTPLEDSLETLLALKQEGKLRAIGLCNYDEAGLREAKRACPELSCLQTPLSLIRREWEGALQSCCQELELGVLAYEPLARGLLTGKFTAPPRFPPSDMRARDPRFRGGWFQHSQALIRDLSRAAARLGLPLSALSLGWVADRPGITSAIVGFKRRAQLEESLQASRLLGRARVWRVVDGVAAHHGGW